MSPKNYQSVALKKLPISSKTGLILYKNQIQFRFLNYVATSSITSQGKCNEFYLLVSLYAV